MFLGMTLGEQRTLMALAVVIATGLGVQNYRERQQHQGMTFQKAQTAEVQPAQAAIAFTPAPMPQAPPLPHPQALAPAPSPPQPAPTAMPSGRLPNGLLDLNLATADELDALPGIGEVRAKSIIDYRTRSGGFRSVEDLLAIEGIGPKTLENLRPLVAVSGR